MCSKTDDVGWRDVVRQYGTIWEYNASFSNNAANHLHLLDKHAKLDTLLTVCFALSSGSNTLLYGQFAFPHIMYDMKILRFANNLMVKSLSITVKLHFLAGNFE